MPRNMLLSEGFLPMESFKLGCFLVDINNPHVSRYDPVVQLDPNDVLTSPQINYMEINHTGSMNSFAASLTSLLSLSCSKTLDTSARVTSEQINTYKLANSGSWFRKALKEKETRVWIEDQWHEGYGDLFFIVGYHTMSNASIVLGADEAQEISGQVQMPVSEAMAAGGVVLPDGGILDPKVSAQHGESRGAKLRFTAPGERICALQYRKVVYRWLSSRNLDRAMLSRENVWKSFKTLRAARNKKDKTDVDVDDVIEVDLADETESKEDKEIYRVLGDEGKFFLESE